MITKFVDDVLTKVSDIYRDPSSPLLANAYNNEENNHIADEDGTVPSNLARQMNFMRTLYNLYVMGDEKYKGVLWDNFNYYFNNFQYEEGLLEWGGHRWIDLKSLKSTGRLVHELKNDYPAYNLMYKVNPDKTIKYIEAFWNAHVLNWGNLEISRHGDYEAKRGNLWDNSFDDPDPFIEVSGLSFINAGNDLIFSAIEHYMMTGNKKALVWGKRLQWLYVKARNKETGLGVYQFNKTKAKDVTDDFSITTSNYGDRAFRQLGPELGANALEGNVLLGSKANMIYGFNTLMMLYEYESVGEDLAEFVLYCRDGLNAYSKHAYIHDKNKFKPILADGQDLTGFELKRDGYYGKKGTVFDEYDAGGLHLLSYSRAAVISEDLDLWETAVNIAEKLDCGCIGGKPGKDVNLNEKTEQNCPYILFALLNLYKATNNENYMYLAERVADNIEKTINNAKVIHINSLEFLSLACYRGAKNNILGKMDCSIFL